ncbi:MAG: NAD-dependent malic enzyme [Candidatus Moranbacteria bacterium CG10_big_fil_rev_8_21_14_0_10_35_21]|nr:MAG: NAD-dependent malic enzyme [Candidatus Moranbacteria bacterium CG10_big_fil_rev_8_21_14_0_10_35_21]
MHESISLSKKIGGKIEIKSKKKLTKETLSVLYTPGVAEVSLAVAKDKKLSFDYTIRKNTIAIVSDGSAVLGLGNIGPEGALPVMEGKALLFKELGGVDAYPIVLATQETKEIIQIVKAIAPTFGGINLEDISAPRCFEIEETLKKELDIPVFHDDQHGTAIVVLAGLINALKLVKKNIKNIKIVISGVGAAGVAIAKLLIKYGAEEIILADSRGIIFSERQEGMNPIKKEMAKITNPNNVRGNLKEALKNTDVFIGVSGPNLLDKDDIRKMSRNSIVFAMSNPIPEIMPAEAKKGGAVVIATGRSDFPNQINNVLAFPGIFRGALDMKTKNITDEHKLKAAEVIAGLVKKPNYGKIIPEALDLKVAKAVAEVFKKQK